MSSAPLTVRPVESKKDRKAFVDLAWEVYEDDAAWVPPLKDEVHGEREDRRREQARDRRRLLTIFAVGLAALFALALWNRASIEDFGRQFCGTTAIPLKLDPQPTSGIGRDWIAQSQKQFDALGCPPSTLDGE